MIKIKNAFYNKKAVIAYLMAGDPNLKASGEYILAAQEAGADMIEIGIPFSDPIAEGAVVQSASMRALHSGTRLPDIFDMLTSIKDKIRVPLVFSTYLNPLFCYGYERFFSRCAEVGISGIIIPDMPFEEQDEVKIVSHKYGVDVVTLVAPTSGNRIKKITNGAQGFVYFSSSMNETSAHDKSMSNLSAMISDIKGHTDIPVVLNLGVATPKQMNSLYAIADGIADGIIVNDTLVQLIEQHAQNAHKAIYEAIRTIKDTLVSVS